MFKNVWWSRLKKLHQRLNSGYPVTYSGCLGDQYTTLGAQRLFFKFFFFSIISTKMRWSNDNSFYNALFWNGLEDKNTNKREKQRDKKRS